MLKTRHILLLFIPAILIVGIVFWFLVLQYEPLYPDPEDAAEANRGASFTIPLLPQDPILGNPRAPKTIIVFEDLGCEACRSQSDMLRQLAVEYPGEFKVIWKLLSVTQFPYSTRPAHAYAYCANQQSPEAFEAFTQMAFVNQTDLSSGTLTAIINQIDLDTDALTACAESEETKTYLDTTEQIARALNIQSVPAIFINNKQVQAPSVIQGWKTLLEL